MCGDVVIELEYSFLISVPFTDLKKDDVVDSLLHRSEDWPTSYVLFLEAGQC